MPDQCKPGAGSIGAGSVRLVIEVSRLVPLSVLGFEVSCGRPWIRVGRVLGPGILEEDDLAAGPLPLPCRVRAGILVRNLWELLAVMVFSGRFLHPFLISLYPEIC